MINKLLLVRKFNASSDFLSRNNLIPFCSQEPLKISPIAWCEEEGITHYGYILQGMKVEDFNRLLELVKTNDYLCVLPYEGNPLKSLHSVGLRINESA